MHKWEFYAYLYGKLELRNLLLGECPIIHIRHMSHTHTHIEKNPIPSSQTNTEWKPPGNKPTAPIGQLITIPTHTLTHPLPRLYQTSDGQAADMKLWFILINTYNLPIQWFQSDSSYENYTFHLTARPSLSLYGNPSTPLTIAPTYPPTYPCLEEPNEFNHRWAVWSSFGL